MILEIEVDGGTWTVSISPLGSAGPAGGHFQMTLQAPGGRAPETIEIDARRTDLGLSMLEGPSRRVIDAALTPRPRGACFVQLPHIDIITVVDGRRSRRGDGGAPGGHGEQRISAPMPGRVLRVLVKPGDEVQARQGLVVIEAMKMENELSALRPGRVRDVLVAEGTSVESGRALVIID